MTVRTQAAFVILSAVLLGWTLHAGAMPQTIAYSASPNPYFNEHAADVAKLYDGFFFVLGTWDEGVRANIGLGEDSPPTTNWAVQARENLINLKKAGVAENLLGVCFGENDPWPSPETLCSSEYTQKMIRHFSALGNAARELGFRGVSIDVEYCYKRYDFDAPCYEGSPVDGLMRAAGLQGQAIIQAVLDAFPEAVVFSLPGELWMRPIGRAFLLGMLSGMAERNAPGGLHLGYERSYCLWDGPVSQLAIPQAAYGAAELFLNGRDHTYWKTHCSVAPGVWPFHMVETGGKDYPVRPWPEEMAELNQQMKLLRAVTAKYLWSFSAAPAWYVPSPELEQRYGLKPQSFEHAGDVLRQWHEILADKTPGKFDREKPLMQAIHRYHDGKLSYSELCGRFGTPADWMLLGPLANPFTAPKYAAPVYALNEVDPFAAFYGRDGMVRWFPFHNYEPMGSVSLRAAFEWRATDNASVQAFTCMTAPRREEAVLHFGWDDGAVVWFNDRIVFDKRDYPEKGHGMQFQDRYLFEEHVPLTIPKGTSSLRVACINSRGVWGFSLRITGKDGFPIKGVKFHLPN